MGIIKDIWNTIFGKKRQENRFERGGSIAEPEMKVVHKKSEDKIESGSTYTENEFLEFDSENLKSKENKMDSQIKFEVSEPTKNKKAKNVVGQKTLSEIKDYLLTYGSIDVITCKAKFDVKSLKNFIWQLRKDGLEILTEKVELHNEMGQKVEVINYRLITKK
jgi:hypothetical protein